ncbi:MAG: hypothetical protein V4474_01685 [Patescibacteria group bacterium]
MKSKILPALSTALLISAAMVTIASAQDVTAVNVNANINATAEVHAQGTTSADLQAEDRDNATGEATETEHATGASASTSANGEVTAASHRSAVASFVQSLLAIANREGGVGAQVRAVAQSQQDSASTSADAMAKVEARSALKTLFLGSDYHSLGQLRSEMATTSANIAKLKALLAQTTDASVQADLSAQIQVLENQQAEVNAFVQAHESSFSFFGWFVKLFVK